MQGIAKSSMRVGKKYRLVNYGEVFEFYLFRITPNNEYVLKDLNSLEKYLFHELVKFGKGTDFYLEEIAD